MFLFLHYKVLHGNQELILEDGTRAIIQTPDTVVQPSAPPPGQTVMLQPGQQIIQLPDGSEGIVQTDGDQILVHSGMPRSTATSSAKTDNVILYQDSNGMPLVMKDGIPVEDGVPMSVVAAKPRSVVQTSIPVTTTVEATSTPTLEMSEEQDKFVTTSEAAAKNKVVEEESEVNSKISEDKAEETVSSTVVQEEIASSSVQDNMGEKEQVHVQSSIDEETVTTEIISTDTVPTDEMTTEIVEQTTDSLKDDSEIDQLQIDENTINSEEVIEESNIGVVKVMEEMDNSADVSHLEEDELGLKITETARLGSDEKSAEQLEVTEQVALSMPDQLMDDGEESADEKLPTEADLIITSTETQAVAKVTQIDAEPQLTSLFDDIKKHTQIAAQKDIKIAESPENKDPKASQDSIANRKGRRQRRMPSWLSDDEVSTERSRRSSESHGEISASDDDITESSPRKRSPRKKVGLQSVMEDSSQSKVQLYVNKPTILVSPPDDSDHTAEEETCEVEIHRNVESMEPVNIVTHDEPNAELPTDDAETKSAEIDTKHVKKEPEKKIEIKQVVISPRKRGRPPKKRWVEESMREPTQEDKVSSRAEDEADKKQSPRMASKSPNSKKLSPVKCVISTKGSVIVEAKVENDQQPSTSARRSARKPKQVDYYAIAVGPKSSTDTSSQDESESEKDIRKDDTSESSKMFNKADDTGEDRDSDPEDIGSGEMKKKSRPPQTEDPYDIAKMFDTDGENDDETNNVKVNLEERSARGRVKVADNIFEIAQQFEAAVDEAYEESPAEPKTGLPGTPPQSKISSQKSESPSDKSIKSVSPGDQSSVGGIALRDLDSDESDNDDSVAKVMPVLPVEETLTKASPRKARLEEWNRIAWKKGDPPLSGSPANSSGAADTNKTPARSTDKKASTVLSSGKRIGIQWNKMKFTVNRPDQSDRMSLTSRLSGSYRAHMSPDTGKKDVETKAKNIKKREDLETFEKELNGKDSQLEKRDQRLRALDQELDGRSSMLRVKEARLSRLEQQLRSREKDLKRRERLVSKNEQVSVAENERESKAVLKDNKQIKDLERKLEKKMKDLQHWEKDLTDKEKDLSGIEFDVDGKKNMLENTEQQLGRLARELFEKAEYLQSQEQTFDKKKMDETLKALESIKSGELVEKIELAPKEKGSTAGKKRKSQSSAIQLPRKTQTAPKKNLTPKGTNTRKRTHDKIEDDNRQTTVSLVNVLHKKRRSGSSLSSNTLPTKSGNDFPITKSTPEVTIKRKSFSKVDTPKSAVKSLPKSPKSTNSEVITSPKSDKFEVKTPKSKEKEDNITHKSNQTRTVKSSEIEGTPKSFGKSPKKTPQSTAKKIKLEPTTESLTQSKNTNNKTDSPIKHPDTPKSRGRPKKSDSNITPKSKVITKGSTPKEKTPKSTLRSTPKLIAKATPKSATKKTESDEKPMKKTPKGSTSNKNNSKTTLKSTPKSTLGGTPKSTIKATPKSAANATPKSVSKATPKSATKATPKSATKSLKSATSTAKPVKKTPSSKKSLNVTPKSKDFVQKKSKATTPTSTKKSLTPKVKTTTKKSIVIKRILKTAKSPTEKKKGTLGITAMKSLAKSRNRQPTAKVFDFTFFQNNICIINFIDVNDNYASLEVFI